MTDITPPLELVRKWQQEANHNEPMFPQVAAMAAQWGYQQHEKELLDAIHSLEHNPTNRTMTDLFADYCKIAEETFLAEDRDSNFPGENSIPIQSVENCNQNHADKLPPS